jgi:hypothetical protein
VNIGKSVRSLYEGMANTNSATLLNHLQLARVVCINVLVDSYRVFSLQNYDLLPNIVQLHHRSMDAGGGSGKKRTFAGEGSSKGDSQDDKVVHDFVYFKILCNYV